MLSSQQKKEATQGGALTVQAQQHQVSIVSIAQRVQYKLLAAIREHHLRQNTGQPEHAGFGCIGGRNRQQTPSAPGGSWAMCTRGRQRPCRRLALLRLCAGSCPGRSPWRAEGRVGARSLGAWSAVQGWAGAPNVKLARQRGGWAASGT